ncbi:hypothetical protein HPB47_011969 [Ixodes persulcatus]|uniref:Uncharacterized protein n=1 Tax=Ixodes persulcatus TaxID=34615 RepID=A0AC60NUT5_IXOPE|nr:hypothetical protein HPB47_011969 [Ixodes persulcatus]
MQYMNACWERGSIPQQWNTAKVVMIPKPGKRPQLDSLRPISLTSCAGKLMEHVVLGRLNRCMEERELFPHTMVGFRPHLSTQDVMLRLKHQIVDGTGSPLLDTKAILGLDLTKAFDNIIHDAVLDNLRALAVGKRTYEYIQDFLSGRKARLAVGEVESEDICLGGKGTPQGSVLSPYLFNVAMICLPAKLEKIAGLQHTIYADDITLWVTGGSDGYIEEVLQEAIRVIEEYVAPRGLACSPQKSELLLLRPKRGRIKKSNIELFTQGHRIPQVESIRVLGLRIQADGKNREMIQALGGTASQVARLIARISNRNYGTKEGNLMRLVQAFVMSRLAYVVPFMRLGVAEKSKLKCIVRKAYKRALGLPDSTSNEKLAALGVHNTIDELIEAQGTAHEERDWQAHPQEPRPPISPIPKHMHPVHDAKRREARAKALGRTLKEEEGVAYVDAAEYKGRGAMAAAMVNGDGHLVASCSVKTDNPETAEEAEVALTLSMPGVKIIVGATCFGERERVRLVWTPAHVLLPGNEEAHDAARELTIPAGTTSGALIASSGRDRLVTFRDIPDHYTDRRARFPSAHHSLYKRQSTVWRRLQTNTYPCPALLNRWYPDRYTGACKLCGQRANLRHMVCECSNIDRGACTNKLLTQLRDEDSWETTLLSSDPRVQEDLVRLAEDAVGVQGILAVV